MSEQPKSGSSCLKIAGLGCLLLIGLGLVASLLFGGLVWSSARGGGDSAWLEATLRDEEIDAGDRRGTSAEAATSTARPGELADATNSVAIPTDLAPGTPTSQLTLDLSGGSFELRAHDGAEVEVEGEIDESRYRLEREVTVEDDGSRRVKITFAQRASSRFVVDDANRVTVLVPRGEPFTLDGEVKMGESELDLGGLFLRGVDLELAMGDHRIAVSEPTRGVMEQFRVASRMGAVRYTGLGNASPLAVEVRHRMGELRLDLEGPWRGDAAIAMRCSMGQCTADVPDDVHSEVDARATMGGRTVRLPDTGELPPGTPTLHLRARVMMGEVQVR
ncbi:MAG: hypothetical protein DWQ36_00940 [Acidobacteria bacterium]|nr:MAG: hypothetical protein DWQ30_08895 [Acidobacteriota bacterium]REK11822.1 MAG: hypothetical protein DWQ36_00940 [Acidobacteriota bacterium]